MRLYHEVSNTVVHQQKPKFCQRVLNRQNRPEQPRSWEIITTRLYIQWGWKEPDTMDQQMYPVLSYIVRFFPMLINDKSECSALSVRKVVYEDNTQK